ncbi:hypothetical protein D3C87_993540 [compost metagenome]
MKKLRKLLIAFLPILCLAFVMSCSSDDDEEMISQEGKNFKFTITANNVGEQDYLSFVFVGSDMQQSTTIWKINGVAQNNETGVSLGKNDFMGTTKTYVIESTRPLRLVTSGIQCINPGANNPSFTVSYKAEVDGTVVRDDQNVVVESGSDYTHNFTF